MREYKKLVPGFGCIDAGHMDSGCSDSEGLLELARTSADYGADELFLLDLSETDEGHERAIGIIKEIARAIDIPLIAGGRVRRLEDIKKYLYAGAKAAFLDVSRDDNIDLIKEAADRFGDEKIYAYLPGMEYLARAEEFAQLGASHMLLNAGRLSEKDLEQLASRQESYFLFCEAENCETENCGAGNGEAENREAENCESENSRAEISPRLSDCLRLPCVAGAVLICAGAEGRIMGEGGMKPSDMKLGEAKPSDGKAAMTAINCMSIKQQLKAEGVPVDTFESSVPWSQFKQNSDGLVPVVVQDYRTLEVLMVAYMNEEAYNQTLTTGRMTYYSRSRQKLWLKGETSGHFQFVKSLQLDCDNDTILAKVNQIGAACHTGSRTCFFQTLAEKEYKDTNPLKVFEDVYQVILDRKANPKEGSYTNYLFDKGLDKILKKLGEEATEIVIAAKNPNPEEIKYEISDFLYHMMVLMADKGITWEEITEELANR